jgi:hypothetical protein
MANTTKTGRMTIRTMRDLDATAQRVRRMAVAYIKDGWTALEIIAELPHWVGRELDQTEMREVVALFARAAVAA